MSYAVCKTQRLGSEDQETVWAEDGGGVSQTSTPLIIQISFSWEILDKSDYFLIL